LFDSFMEFLRSDLWQIPVSQFIEQRSIGKYKLFLIYIFKLF